LERPRPLHRYICEPTELNGTGTSSERPSGKDHSGCPFDRRVPHDEVEKVPYRRWPRDRRVHDPSLVIFIRPLCPGPRFTSVVIRNAGVLRRVGLAAPLQRESPEHQEGYGAPPMALQRSAGFSCGAASNGQGTQTFDEIIAALNPAELASRRSPTRTRRMAKPRSVWPKIAISRANGGSNTSTRPMATLRFLRDRWHSSAREPTSTRSNPGL
jgi:hypothetical protein